MINSKYHLPDLVFDNMEVAQTAEALYDAGAMKSILPGDSAGSKKIGSWAMGKLAIPENPDAEEPVSKLLSNHAGFVSPDVSQHKPEELLDTDKSWFTKPKPSYAELKLENIINVVERGVQNDGKEDQAGKLNQLLAEAAHSKVVFFPAGVYSVHSTVMIPEGSIVIGEGWSQIKGSGEFFSKQEDPQVMVRFVLLGSFVSS
jgi:glucan 1,3-beta-glucosidase